MREVSHEQLLRIRIDRARGSPAPTLRSRGSLALLPWGQLLLLLLLVMVRLSLERGLPASSSSSALPETVPVLMLADLRVDLLVLGGNLKSLH